MPLPVFPDLRETQLKMLADLAVRLADKATAASHEAQRFAAEGSVHEGFKAVGQTEAYCASAQAVALVLRNL